MELKNNVRPLQHLLGKGHRDISFTSERVGMFCEWNIYKYDMDISSQILNRSCILKLADVYVLDYINHINVLELIILLWVFGFSHLCFWTLPIFKLLYNLVILRYPRMHASAYGYFTCIFLGRVTRPSAKPLFLEDQFLSLSLASLLRPVRLGRSYHEYLVPAGIFRKVIEAPKSPIPHND